MSCLNKNKEENVEKNINFYPLSPKENIKNKKIYNSAIKWSIDNKKTSNIAITGPYGSGKSSVIETFKKEYEDKYNILEISIANFDEAIVNKKSESDNNDLADNLNNDDEQLKSNYNNKNDGNSLEKSILQQMFYHIDNKKITHSRFKRIQMINPFKHFFEVSLFIFSILLLTFFIKNEDLISYYTTVNNLFKGNTYITIILMIVLYLLVTYFISQIAKQILSKFQISKFSFANATLENTKDESSIFDKYLDEIFYFFETTDINVVIFEDLDRFNNIQIFERLRELNILLNNSDNIKRKITFIYSTKDDIFENSFSKTIGSIRAKFFDFIIPVLPVINSSNSIEQFKSLFSSYNYYDQFDTSFLNTIAIYINDMRLLLNIHNEFLVYYHSISNVKIDINKLLALITFKNIYPKEFALFQQDKGLIHELFNSKHRFIEEIKYNLSQRIEILKKLIDNIENEKLESIKELSDAYILELLGYQKAQLNIDGKTYYSYSDDVMSAVENGRHMTLYNSEKSDNKQVSQEEVFTIFGTKKNYLERRELINAKSVEKSEEIRREIAQLEKEINNFDYLSVSEILNKIDTNNESSKIIERLENLPLLNYLLQNGYIDETFNYYITYFYPGTLTKNDINFIMSVKNGTKIPVEKLENISEIFNSFNLNEMKSKEILHQDFIEFMFSGDNEFFKKEISQNLLDKTNESIEFLSQYFNSEREIEKLILSLMRASSEFWSLCVRDIQLTNSQLNNIVEVIFNNMTNEELTSQNELSIYINCNIKTISEIVKQDKLSSYLISTNTKITDLRGLNTEILAEIKKNKTYLINFNNLKELFSEINYIEDILEIDDESLKYIKDNIGELINNIILADEYNSTYIHPDVLNFILENEEDENIIEQLIGKLNNNTRLKDVLKNCWKDVIIYNKAKINIENFYEYYTNFGLDKILAQWLNQDIVYKALYQQKEELLQIFSDEKLSLELFTNQDLDDSVIRKFSKYLTNIDKIALENLSTERVSTLISNNLIAFNVDIYNDIYRYQESLVSKYILKNINEFLAELMQLNINENIFNELFSKLKSEVKIKIINKIYNEVESFENETADNILKFIIQERPNELLSENIDYKKLVKYGSTNLSLRLLLEIENFLNNEEIYLYLKELEFPINMIDIYPKGKKIKLTNNKLNKEFTEMLKRRGLISSISEIENDFIGLNMKKK